MVISKKYKYLFIELPRTGTTALSHALCKHYSGEKKLNKHTNLYQAKKHLKTDVDDYFIFSGIRHPMDRTVSVYVKYSTNYGNIRENYLKKTKEIPWSRPVSKLIHYKTYRRVIFAQKPGVTFEKYLKKYYKVPYSDWAILDHHNMDFVIRFENLEDDFKKICELTGMEWNGPIEQRNVTKKKKNWQEYYTDEIRKRAYWVFAPYMNEVGYHFPGESEPPNPSALNRFCYQFINLFRKYIWKHFSTGK